MSVIAQYVPFLDPIHALQDAWFLLLIPLTFGISIVYRAIRVQNLDHFWRGVVVMTTQVVLAIVALAVALVVLVQLVLPVLPVDR